jgi:hypothetical protein
MRVEHCHTDPKVKESDIPEKRDRNCMERLIEGVQQQSFTVLVKQAVVVFWHVPEELKYAHATLLFSIDHLYPLHQFSFVEVGRN